MVLLRFAPSPTGSLHVGGLRTALFNYLYAKKSGGKWILRIEDTDASRHHPGAVEDVRSTLAWAGLEYDYGPGRGGPQAPYYQSKRLDLYHTYAQKLLDSGYAYRCFCTPDQLQLIREKLARAGSNATYDKTCLHLTQEEASRNVRAGKKSIIRLNDGNIPSRPTPSDIVFGTVRDAHASLQTDPVLVKSDLFPTYHLASVVDDHEMGITHVFRGEEWLPSFPLHLDLYACLSLRPPQFAHLPLLLNRDGSKMSKRNGDVSVIDYIRRGWEPEAILNWVALAGWGVHHNHPGTESSTLATSEPHSPAPNSTEVMSLPELVKNFDLSAFTHRRNILDPQKLEYLNRQHLLRLASTPGGADSFAYRVLAIVKDAFPSSPHLTVEYIKDVLHILEPRLINIYDVPSQVPYLFVEPDLGSEEAQAMLKSSTADDKRKIRLAVGELLANDTEPWDRTNIERVLHASNAKSEMPHKLFMTVLRHALSGMKTGPSVPEIMSVLGRDRTLQRLSREKR